MGSNENENLIVLIKDEFKGEVPLAAVPVRVSWVA